MRDVVRDGFRFESFWLSNNECKNIVADAWEECLGANIDFHIANCADKLAEWSKHTFGALRSRIKTSERKLNAAQRCPPDANMMRNCKALAFELDELHRLEESYWHMRSRENELRDGDQISKYFHHKASSRRRRNSIKGINDDQGMWRTSKSDIEHLVTSYYETLFTTSSPSGFDEAVAGIQTMVTNDMNDILDVEPTAEEIRTTVFQMHPTKP